MRSISTQSFFKALLILVVAVVFALTLIAEAFAQKAGQKPPQAAPPAATQLEQPHYNEYRGVRLGMPASDVRNALGTPKETDGRQEFYAVSETEMAQVFYDAQRNVWAVTVSYLGGNGNAPTPEKIFGGPVETKPDGSIYKMVKYEHMGYYVAYSRDAGDAPFVSVVMQKLPN